MKVLTYIIKLYNKLITIQIIEINFDHINSYFRRLCNYMFINESIILFNEQHELIGKLYNAGYGYLK